MSLDFHDRYGSDWVVVYSWPESGRHEWMRVADGAHLHVQPDSVTLHADTIHVDDPAGWLVEHLGSPAMDLGDLAALRRRKALDEAFRRGWTAAWVASLDYEERPRERRSFCLAPTPKGNVDALRSVPVP